MYPIRLFARGSLTESFFRVCEAHDDGFDRHLVKSVDLDMELRAIAPVGAQTMTL